MRTVYYQREGSPRIAAVRDIAIAAGVPTQAVEQHELASLAGTTRHHGIVASVRPFAYVPLEAVVAQRPDLLLLADHIQDPHNLGAVIRTALAAGVGAVIVPKDGSVAVTATVEAAAAGATAVLPICRVTNTARTLRELKANEYWVAGLAPREGTPLFRFAPPKPLTIVLGGEEGMRRLVAQQCQVLVSIPMFGPIESLNASVAVALALYHVRRQWEVT